MNGNTYGAKATRLLSTWGDVLGASASAKMRSYIATPTLYTTKSGAVVADPCVAATTLMAQFVSRTVGSDAAASRLTVVEVAAWCQVSNSASFSHSLGLGATNLRLVE